MEDGGDEAMLSGWDRRGDASVKLSTDSSSSSGAQELKYAAFLSGSIVGGLMVHCHWSKAQKDLEKSC